MDHTLTIGRIVHYRLHAGPHAGEYRPAIVVRVGEYEMVNLQVFLDGENDFVREDGSLPQMAWVTSADHGYANRQWLWPDENALDLAP